MVDENQNPPGGGKLEPLSSQSKLEKTQLPDAKTIAQPSGTVEDQTQAVTLAEKTVRAESTAKNVDNSLKSGRGSMRKKADSQEKKNDGKKDVKDTTNKKPVVKSPKKVQSARANKAEKSPKIAKGSAQKCKDPPESIPSAESRKEKSPRTKKKALFSERRKDGSKKGSLKKDPSLKSTSLAKATPEAPPASPPPPSPAQPPVQLEPSAEAVAPKAPPNPKKSTEIGSKDKVKAAPNTRPPGTAPLPKVVPPNAKPQEKKASTIAGAKKKNQSARNSMKGSLHGSRKSEKTQSKRKKAAAKARKLFKKLSGRSAKAPWGSGRAGLETSKKSKRCKKSHQAKEYFHTPEIVVQVDGEWDQLDVVFSYGMVVRFIGKSSPLLDYLILGDQLIGIGTTVANSNTIPLEPKNVEDALKNAKGSQMTLTVVRPVGMTHCGPREIKRSDNYMYFVAELPPSMKVTDLTLGCMNGKAYVTRAEGAVSNVLMKDDRILEYNGQSLVKGNKPEALGQMIAQGLASQQGSKNKEEPATFTCLVERPLAATVNTGLTAAVKKNQMPVRMGDDAREIGAREACRFRHFKNFEMTVPPIVTTASTMRPPIERKSDERMPKKKRTGVTEKREYSTTPTDVEDTTTLSRVTPGSGLAKFLGFFRKK